MPRFGSNSKRVLSELHPNLQRVATAAIQHIDFSLICGYRGRVEQTHAFNSGASKARFGQSPHNFAPALAFDFLPYPFKGWHDIDSFEKVGYEILLAAIDVNVKVTWGKNFKGLVDLPHIELANWRELAKR